MAVTLINELIACFVTKEQTKTFSTEHFIPIKLSIDGYIRQIETTAHNLMIPRSINNLIYSFYDPWFNLLTMPQSLKHKYPNILFYQNTKTNKQYFIICPLYLNTRNIYIYNCLENKWNILTQYPSKFDPSCHGAVIDPTRDTLYIFHGQSAIFGAFNLLTNNWKIYCHSHNEAEAMKYNISVSSNACSVWIPNPINQLHVVVRNVQQYVFHMRYDEINQMFMKASVNGINNNERLFGSKLVRITIKNDIYLLMIGGYHNNRRGDEIWYCYVCNATKTYDCKWKLFPKKLPIRNYAQVVVAFNQILILLIGDISNDKDNMNVEENDQVIYYLEVNNVDNNTQNIKWMCSINNEWIKCDVKPPKKSFRMGITNDNYLHFMSHYDPQSHMKIHISNVIPYKLYKKYHR